VVYDLGTTLTNQNSVQEESGEQIEVRECLLSFGAESFVLQFAIQKFKDYNIQNYNFAFCFVWVRNLVAHIEGGT
jgi:hypothetical protein